MNEGRERPFVSVKFAPVGRAHTFLLPDLDLDAEVAGVTSAPLRRAAATLVPGDTVVVATAEGPAIGTIVRAIPSLAERKRPAEDSSDRVLRKANREDIV